MSLQEDGFVDAGRHTSLVEDESGREKVDVVLGQPSIYNSVMVSAFGGVSVKMSHGNRAKVHPLALLFLCIPVFIAQVSILLYLRLDLEFEQKLDDDDAKSTELLRLKLVVVVVTYLMNFQNLMQAFQHFIFILNPITWVEVKHCSPTEWVGEKWKSLHWMFKVLALLPWPFFAVCMEALVNYLVCIDSVSVIFNSPDAKEAIFNSLAITFIVDLGAHWWNFCAYVFHIGSFGDYEFLVEPGEVWEGNSDKLTKEKRDSMSLPRLVEFIVWATTWKCFGFQHTFLRSGYGARRLSQASSIFVLAFVYCRQLFVVLQAVQTKILPVARDICTEYHMQVGSATWRTFEKFLFVSIEDELYTKIHSNHTLRARCHDEYRRLEWTDIVALTKANAELVALCAVLIFMLMLAPTFGHMLHTYFCNVDPSSMIGMRRMKSPSSPGAWPAWKAVQTTDIDASDARISRLIEQKVQDRVRPLQYEITQLKQSLAQLQQQRR